MYCDAKPLMTVPMGLLYVLYLRYKGKCTHKTVVIRFDEISNERFEAEQVKAINEFVEAVGIEPEEKPKPEPTPEPKPKKAKAKKKIEPEPTPEPQPEVEPEPTPELLPKKEPLDEKEPLLTEPTKKPSKRGAKKTPPVAVKFYESEDLKKEHNRLLQSLAKKLDAEFASKDETRDLFKSIRDTLVGVDFLLEGKPLQSFINKFNELWKQATEDNE